MLIASSLVSAVASPAQQITMSVEFCIPRIGQEFGRTYTCASVCQIKTYEGKKKEKKNEKKKNLKEKNYKEISNILM